MRHYCRNCKYASVWKENNDGSQAYACGICHSWITAKSPTGIMDHCTGWFWKGWYRVYLITGIAMFVICIIIITTLFVCSLTGVVD